MNPTDRNKIRPGGGGELPPAPYSYATGNEGPMPLVFVFQIDSKEKTNPASGNRTAVMRGQSAL